MSTPQIDVAYIAKLARIDFLLRLLTGRFWIWNSLNSTGLLFLSLTRSLISIRANLLLESLLILQIPLMNTLTSLVIRMVI